MVDGLLPWALDARVQTDTPEYCFDERFPIKTPWTAGRAMPLIVPRVPLFNVLKHALKNGALKKYLLRISCGMTALQKSKMGLTRRCIEVLCFTLGQQDVFIEDWAERLLRNAKRVEW